MITKNASDILHKIAAACPTCGKEGYNGLGQTPPGQEAPPAQQPPASGRPQWFEDWLKERDQQKQAPQVNDRNAPSGPGSRPPRIDFDEIKKKWPKIFPPDGIRSIRDIQADNQTPARIMPRGFRQGIINQPL